MTAAAYHPPFEFDGEDMVDAMLAREGGGDWDAQMPQLILYVKAGCPFCEKVEAFADEAGIPLMFRDIGEEEYREELRQLGGKVQVPFLVDETRGVMMYESDDIIAYLEEHYA